RTVKKQMLVLPLASVAVLVTVVTPSGKVLPLGGALTRLVTAQLSVAVTVKVTLLRLQRPASAGSTRLLGQVSTGFCVSVIVTVKVQVLVLPLASVAVLVTVVTPSGKVPPLGGVLTRLVTAQLSVDRKGDVKWKRVERPAPGGSTRLLGQVSTGFCVSVIVTVKVQVLVLPL